jgi:hypothetical protein
MWMVAELQPGLPGPLGKLRVLPPELLQKALQTAPALSDLDGLSGLEPRGTTRRDASHAIQWASAIPIFLDPSRLTGGPSPTLIRRSRWRVPIALCRAASFFVIICCKMTLLVFERRLTMPPFASRQCTEIGG